MSHAPGRVAVRLPGRRRSSAAIYRVAALTHPRTSLRGPRPTRHDWVACGSDGDRPKRSDLFVARTADPIPLSIQGGKRATAPQARTPEVAGGPGDRGGGCANAYESVGRKQLVVQGLCGFCAAPRNSGGDRVPIELPTGGAELLHCREKRGLLSRSPASILIHGEGCWSEELGQVGVDGCVLLPGLLARSAMRYATVLVRAPGRVVAPDIRHRTRVGEYRKRATMHGAHWVICGGGGGTRGRQRAISTATTNAQLGLCSYRWTQVPPQSWCLGKVGSDHSCAPVKKRPKVRLNLWLVDG